MIPLVVYILMAFLVLTALYDGQKRMESVEEYCRRQASASEKDYLKLTMEVVEAPAGTCVLLWDAAPAFVDQVDGVLVPYFVAEGPTRRDCDRQVGDYLRQLALDRGGFVSLEFV